MNQESKLQMIGRKVCFIVKPNESNNMLVYTDEGEAQRVADRLEVESGIIYEIFPSYLDPVLL